MYPKSPKRLTINEPPITSLFLILVKHIDILKGTGLKEAFLRREIDVLSLVSPSPVHTKEVATYLYAEFHRVPARPLQIVVNTPCQRAHHIDPLAQRDKDSL